MRHLLAAMMCAGSVLGVQSAERVTELKTEIDKVSYSIGMNIGDTLKQREMEINLEIMASAIRDILGEEKTLLTPDDARQVLIQYNQTQSQRVAERKMKAATVFLEANAKLDGVKTTESGLQYKIYNEGSGPKPALTDTVSVHYRGTLPDGTEFDNSYSKGTGPVQFPVTRVVKGWTEALQMMTVGSKWQLVIPPHLGYGERGQGNRIPPNSVLLFDIELIGIEKAPPAPPASVTSAPVRVTPAPQNKPPAPVPAPAPAPAPAPKN